MTEAHIDQIGPTGLVSGWARNPASPFPLGLELWLDGEKVGATTAAWFRRDLLKLGIGHGHYGFNCQIRPRSARHGVLEVRELGHKTPLVRASLAPGKLIGKTGHVQTVESLLRRAHQWTMDDLADAIEGLELEQNYADVGAKRYIGMIYQFLLGRWPDEPDYDHYLGELRAGALTATEVFRIVHGSQERKSRREPPVSPYDVRFLFRLGYHSGAPVANTAPQRAALALGAAHAGSQRVEGGQRGGVLLYSPVVIPRIPPWVPVAAEVWCDTSQDALTGLATDFIPPGTGSSLRLPKEAALLWERRADLQQAFDVSRSERLADYIAWCVTSGMLEGSIDPEGLSEEFIARFAQVTPVSSRYGDVPLTEGMNLVGGYAATSKTVPGWVLFPAERRGRLEYAQWFAFVAPRLFGWPEAMVAPVRRYFHEPTLTLVDGFALNRACMAVWELRPDLQMTFPLADQASVRGFLRWLLTTGLTEAKIRLDDFDPRLRGFLLQDSPRYKGVSQLLELVYELRPDLQQHYNLDTPAGNKPLLEWAEFSLWEAVRPMAIGEALLPLKPQEDIVHFASVALSGFWSIPTGRGEDLRMTAHALTAAGFTDFVVVDFATWNLLRPDGTALPAGTRLQVAVNVLHSNPETAFDDARLLKRHGIGAHRVIGWWAWELEWLPDYWRHAYGFYDEIWAATRFAQAAFARAELRPVKLVPTCVELPESDAAAALTRAGAGLPQDATLFLFLFDFGSFAARKNPEGVILAFQRAFPRGDNSVYLLIKTSGAETKPDDLARLTEFAAGDPRIEVRDATLERAEVLDLIRLSDAFVSLHRAEGFGRGPAEAMSLGKPVIVTNYSGTTDYTNGDCALLVDYETVTVQMTEYPGVAGQSWAEPNLETAARHMQWVHTNPDEAKALGLLGQRQIEQLYNAKLAGNAILAALELSTGEE